MNYHKILLFISLLILFSCSDRKMAFRLDDVECIMEDRPDSALAILEAFPKSKLNSRMLRARYSLLYAMALDKNYIDTTDVSIIEPAIHYFDKHGTADERMKSYYYQGIAYFNREEYDNAIVSFSYAEEMIPKAKDMRYVGLVYSRISDLCNRTYNNDDEIKYVELAEKTFSDNGIDKYRFTTLERMGQALFGVRRYEEAEETFLGVLNSTAPDYLKYLAKEDYALLLAARPNRDSDKALALFNEVLSEVGTLRDVNYWASYAFTLASCGYTKESEQVFSQLYSAESKDFSIIDIWRSAACESTGNYHDAFSLLQKSLFYQDSLLNIKLSQTTSKAQMDYLALKSSQIQIKDKNKQIRLMVIITILALILVSSYFVYHAKNERLKKERVELADIAEAMRLRLRESEEGRVLEKVTFEGEVSNRDSEISSLRREIETREKTLAALRSEYAHMYKSQFKYLGDLCETFLLANERTDSQRIVYEKVREMIKNISSDKAGQKRFEKMVDKSLSNIMKHFREEFPKYSEEDYRFISYIFVGFDATTLCIIFNMPSVAAVYMKKSRIKRTVHDSHAVFRDRYLEMIG